MTSHANLGFHAAWDFGADGALQARGPAIASVTNFGTLGVRWATPIPLPNETLIVGLGYGEKRPFWDEATERFVPRLEADLTISFDHRVIDGASAARFTAYLASLLADMRRVVL